MVPILLSCGHMTDRKLDHLALTNASQISENFQRVEFDYEPLLSSHENPDISLEKVFLDKVMKYPIWISSMTGGTGKAAHINQNLSRIAGEFGLGMGLGSCRSLLDSDEYFDDFDLHRNMQGMPFWANIGIAQLETLIINSESEKLDKLVTRLNADGVIVHVNPLQEWFQPEGDVLKYSPIETIKKFLKISSTPVIVKEVGQGMGPKSLLALMQLPIMAIEFGAFGGTNFSKLEALRNSDVDGMHHELVNIGHNAMQMVEITNDIIENHASSIKCKNFIISGGIRHYLDGYHLIEKSRGNAVFAMAAPFLEHASKSEDDLRNYVSELVRGLKLTKSFIKIKDSK
jgi:isopentenyl-diphosphate delta-isomerase